MRTWQDKTLVEKIAPPNEVLPISWAKSNKVNHNLNIYNPIYSSKTSYRNVFGQNSKSGTVCISEFLCY